ncbi:MAG: hypothetical protein K2X03_18015 [Bryobacteraceae bacterium]|nr:hypothetical protein [Bryobacteraceae bacterium]
MRLFLIDAVGNLVFFALAYYWLGLRLSSIGNTAVSVLLAAGLLTLVAYLMALAFNREPVAAVRRTLPMLAWLGIVALVLGVFAYLDSYTTAVGQWLGSALTFATRTPVQLDFLPRTVLAILLLVLTLRTLLPVAVRVANGAGGLRDWRAVPLSVSYLAAVFAWAVVGSWLPWKLFWWIPSVSSFAGQMASFVLRAGAAFVLYVGAWLVFAGYCRAKTLTPER